MGMVCGRDVVLGLVAGTETVALPFSGCSVRDRIDVLAREAAVEGDGCCGAIAERVGSTGGVTTSLTGATVPALFSALFGRSSAPVYVSETRDLFRVEHSLCALDVADRFDIWLGYGAHHTLYPRCRCTSFEMRIHRGEAVRAHFEVDGDIPAEHGTDGMPHLAVYENPFERFGECGVVYAIDGKEYPHLYALTLSVDKAHGCKTEVFIHRALTERDIPDCISELVVTARLQRVKHEEREYGRFEMRLCNLQLATDETFINTADAVIAPLRYAASGAVTAFSYFEGGGA